jgi:hypothetical protein
MNYAPRPFPPPALDDPEQEIVPPRRMYLFEPGWRIGVKAGSQREFCYMMAPGQDFYHRLLDGEIFMYRDDERLCLACALRRGLIAFEPKQLREAIIPIPADPEAIPLDLGWRESDRSPTRSPRDQR